MTYAFRPVTRADYPLLRGWLAQPHMQGWWGDPDTEIALIEEELDSPRVDERLVCAEGTPFAYVQDYNAHAFGAPHYADQPAGARALDTFLGDPAYLGQGHASAYLRQRASDLCQSAPCVLVDPDPENTRAIATYAKAGFIVLDERPCEDGTPAQIMRFTLHLAQ